MASWVRDDAEYKFRQINELPEIRVRVTGVLDTTESERPKMILQDSDDPKMPSLEDPKTRDRCISTLAASMPDFDAKEVDWYIRDRDGQLGAVSIGYEKVTKEDPRYGELVRTTNFSRDGAEKEKEFFPDITVNELRSTVSPVEPNQRQQLNDAFITARQVERPVEKENTQEARLAPEFNGSLSNEYIRPNEHLQRPQM